MANFSGTRNPTLYPSEKGKLLGLAAIPLQNTSCWIAAVRSVQPESNSAPRRGKKCPTAFGNVHFSFAASPTLRKQKYYSGALSCVCMCRKQLGWKKSRMFHDVSYEIDSRKFFSALGRFWRLTMHLLLPNNYSLEHKKTLLPQKL